MDDRCVICGKIIPEGSLVCLICERTIMEGKKIVYKRNRRRF